MGASITVDQLVPYLGIENQVSTVEAGKTPRVSITLPPVTEPTRQLVLRGSIAAGTPPLVEHVALPEPALYAAEVWRTMLVQRGVQVAGTARAQHAATTTAEPYLRAWRAETACPAGAGEPERCGAACPPRTLLGQVLATKTSVPLTEDVVFTLKTSANLHAENLLGALGPEDACPGAAAVHGAGLVRRWLLQVGLQAEDFVFFDGSGLSTKDLVAPRAEAELLAYAARQPWFAGWKAALPVGGVDGTLQHRFAEAPLRGRVEAKTGTLGESRTLAGYLQAASGREVVFVIMEDNHTPGSGEDEAVMDRIVGAIAANE